MGPITGQLLSEQTKLEILTVIETSQQQGISVRRSCAILAVTHWRIVRWQQRTRTGGSLANLTPGPKAPLHRVLPEEIDQIVGMARSQQYVDLSHRILAVTAWDSQRPRSPRVASDRCESPARVRPSERAGLLGGRKIAPL